MPKALKKATDRQRKEKFSTEELLMLTQTLSDNAAVVFANDMRRETLLKQKAIWVEVGMKVSAVGSSTRTVRECRKKRDDLRLRVRMILAENHKTATAGGSGSPIKLKEWEETCTNLIRVECIEGVGRMEHGVADTSDGATEGPPSAAASSAGEAAAIVPLSDVDEPTDLNLAMHTSSPAGTPEPSPQHTPGSNFTGDKTMEAFSSPPEPTSVHRPASECAAATPPQPDTALDLASIIQRQQALTVLVGQHIEEAARLRAELRETSRHSREGMESCTDRLCGELICVQEVLTRIADAMDLQFPPPPAPGQSATSSSTSSRQTSPLRRSARTTRCTSSQPPNAGPANDQ
ncbi:myb-related transcription factor, partner of profilin-like [Ambystoma mexicanum]|uniref:myb-related transcription factor, partner of profilin-like n=1 Tax=Ambystoma mexicanum TaxID=8296 RepID=UPI0037E72F77